MSRHSFNRDCHCPRCTREAARRAKQGRGEPDRKHRARRAAQEQRAADELPERDFYEGDSPDC